MLDEADAHCPLCVNRDFSMASMTGWPDNPWVEGVNRQQGNRVFCEEWEAVQFSKWIREDDGDGTCCLNDFDHRPDA